MKVDRSYLIMFVLGPVGVEIWQEKLRLHANCGAKTSKIQTPLVRFAGLFFNQIVFKKFERSFFDRVAIDAKSL